MAEAKLNFNESALDKTSGLYDLYNRLYEGMKAANTITPPDFITNPPLTAEGEVDSALIAAQLEEYSTILMKNSAYLYANSIMATVSGGGSGGSAGVGFLSRSGDTMTGALGALYGFQAGYNGELILEISKDSEDKNFAHFYGDVITDGSISTNSSLHVGNDGIYFGSVQTMYIDEKGNLVISGSGLIIDAPLVLNVIKIGDVIVNEDGIFFKEFEYYHGGNSNNAETDWTMKDAFVHGDLTVHGNFILNGPLSALHGFELGANGKRMIYSDSTEDDSEYFISLASDLSLLRGYGVKLDETYIIRIRESDTGIVSFSAPGRVMNLGDSDGEISTKYISLQSSIYDAAGITQIISQFGDGNFKNSLTAGCGNSGPTVLQTYYTNKTDCGVVFYKNIKFGDVLGPFISTNDAYNTLSFTLPYTFVDETETVRREFIPISFKHKQTTSLFRDLSKEWSASVHIDSEAEFIVFDKPVESVSFTIQSEKYKTRLIENALFFNDGVFLEGVTDGIYHNGNSYFAGNLSSRTFASGFAGYGWAIMESELFGGYAATFDELTIRKKMRVFELEVQKLSVTNGSLWVSDACSGDLVEELI